EHGEVQRLAIAAPYRRVVTGGMAAILEADVVLVRPEVRKLGVRDVPTDDGCGDAATLAFGDFPVLDPDRPTQDRVLVQRDVAADIDVLRRPEAFVDANSSAVDRQAQSLWQIEVRLDPDRDQRQVHLMAGSVRKRDANDTIAIGVPALDFRAGA